MKKNKDLVEAIKIFIRGEEEIEEPVPEVETGTKIKIVKKDPDVKVRIRQPLAVYFKIRKALNGDYMIYDHPLYDIVIMPKQNKIITFAKKDAGFEPYPSQDKFFDYLLRRGMLEIGSVQSGNIFGSLEAKYPINDKVDTIETLLYVMYHFLQDEVADIKNILSYDEDVESAYTDPSKDDSTELGEVPHEEKKGSLDPGYQPYGLIYRI